MTTPRDDHNFWWHLDQLRGVLVRILAATVLCGIVAFCFKEQLFEIVLAPKSPDFITYRLINRLCAALGIEQLEPFSVELINTGLARQFIIHMQTALWAGVVCVSPLIIYQLFGFIAPALYQAERRAAGRIVWSGYIMFILGILLSYYLIFPLTFRFLGTYQVESNIQNLITLDSYMSTLLLLCLCMGAMFELPVVAWLLARAGLLTADFLRRYRRHSIVVILTIAAIITPTSDVVTLLIVALPIYILYELSILIIRR
ncbi:MAG: twin-arginine translocase subunit TatC [Muribaculaceae bacterium]|nr:twin-arginine translocase subunit TatC [Muribaculaceae bacterium]